MTQQPIGLLGYARSLGAEVAFGREVLRIRAVSARYAIGAHSVVRSALDIRDGWAGAVDTLSVSVAFTAPLRDLVGEPRYGVVHPEVSSAFVPSGRGDDWVFGVAADLIEAAG